jgi:UDP-glucose 4-epimerase
MKKILVTGGAGYVGSHVVLKLLEHGYEPVVVDKLSRSTAANLNRIKTSTGKDFQVFNLTLGLDDLSVLPEDIDAVIHFAAFRLNEGAQNSMLDYYENNVQGTLGFLRWVTATGVRKMIYSSSSAVYGDPQSKTVSESAPLAPLTPYGVTKMFCEQAIHDLTSLGLLDAVVLRYFNVAGNVADGSIGDLDNRPNNFLPALMLSQLGLLDKKFQVFGNNYPTADGTTIRDYVHVEDVANAHIKALDYLSKYLGGATFNVGTGTGTSVFELLEKFEQVTGEKAQYEVAPRRLGDPVCVVANIKASREHLHWRAEKTVEDMILSMWKWYTGEYQTVRPVLVS